MTTLKWDPGAGGAPAREQAARVRGLAPAAREVSGPVAEVLGAVRERGDTALLDLGERFDGIRPDRLLVDPSELERALAQADPEVREAIELLARNVRAVAEAAAESSGERAVTLEDGQRIVLRDVPVGSAGIYVPGGLAAYPSTAVMGCVPASVAGVERVAVATPPDPSGAPPDLVLAACAIAGADEVFATGGAQAIAALAHGTETIDPVDVIAGPGNNYVQEAKLQVSRDVGIDGYAGPSELMVVLDAGCEIEPIALDLCAQAEHSADGLLIAASPDERSLGELAAAVEAIAAERPSVAGDAALALIEVADASSALAASVAIAPEHLQLCGEAEALASEATTAGCVFVGAGGATAFGDYAAGSNHVLPTGGSGRFTGPLGPDTFTRPQATVELDGAAAAALAPHVDALARAEGLPVHGESARARAEEPPDA